MNSIFERKNNMLDGLNKQEIEYRINNNLVNNEDIKNSRSIKTILRSNIITLFNFIHIVLLVLVLTTKAIANTTFIFAIIINTIISIYQKKKKKTVQGVLSAFFSSIIIY